MLGGDDPILVDTGAASSEIMGRLGMGGSVSEQQLLENRLAEHGVASPTCAGSCTRTITIDHPGQDDRFPDATVIANRRELEYSASGLMGAQHPPEYVKHHIDRLHRPGALRLLDLELSGPDEILPGIVCEAAGGHTEGSMNVLVETDEGVACICGDIIDHVHDSLIDPLHLGLASEPQVTGNHGNTKRQEKAAIKRALNSGRFLLPMHDRPARIENGRVVARPTDDAIPGRRFRSRHRLRICTEALTTRRPAPARAARPRAPPRPCRSSRGCLPGGPSR